MPALTSAGPRAAKDGEAITAYLLFPFVLLLFLTSLYLFLTDFGMVTWTPRTTQAHGGNAFKTMALK